MILFNGSWLLLISNPNVSTERCVLDGSGGVAREGRGRAGTPVCAGELLGPRTENTRSRSVHDGIKYPFDLCPSDFLRLAIRFKFPISELGRAEIARILNSFMHRLLVSYEA